MLNLTNYANYGTKSSNFCLNFLVKRELYDPCATPVDKNHAYATYASYVKDENLCPDIFLAIFAFYEVYA